VSVATSDLLIVELAEAVFAIALKERWGKRWRHHRADGRSRRRATRLLPEAVSRYETLLLRVDHLPVPVSDTAHAARSLMADYGLASYDAIHAASAIAVGAEAPRHGICAPATSPAHGLHRPLTTRVVPR
jgi:predicted nucleic acid-binding protein